MIVAGLVLYLVIVTLFVAGVAVAAKRPQPQMEAHNIIVPLFEEESLESDGNHSEAEPLRHAA